MEARARNRADDASVTAHSPIDVLAIAAHRDDVEQTCGGLCCACVPMA